MVNVAVFASGYGSNFEAIVKSGIDVKVLICNDKNAFVIKRALKHNVICITVSKDLHEEELIIEKLKELEIDLIVLAGFMKVLSAKFVSAFENRIINIHPSLLPKYKGLNALKRAYDNNECEVGVTIHYVDDTLDGGKIIDYDKLIVGNLSYTELEKAIHKIEHRLYPKVIKEVIKELLK